MYIDLPSPGTILVAIVFGFGLQLWLAWFKRQMEVDDTDPQMARERLERLGRAAVRTGERGMTIVHLLLVGLDLFVVMVGVTWLIYGTSLGIGVIVIGVISLGSSLAEVLQARRVALIADVLFGLMTIFLGLAGVYAAGRVVRGWAFVGMGLLGIGVGVVNFVMSRRPAQT